MAKICNSSKVTVVKSVLYIDVYKVSWWHCYYWAEVFSIGLNIALMARKLLAFFKYNENTNINEILIRSSKIDSSL